MVGCQWIFGVSVPDELAETSAVDDVHWTKIFDDYIHCQTCDCFHTLSVSDSVFFFRKDASGVAAVVVLLRPRCSAFSFR